MGLGFIPVRKKGKLPPPVISRDYELEYGTDTLEIKPDDGERVVIVDDVYCYRWYYLQENYVRRSVMM